MWGVLCAAGSGFYLYGGTGLIWGAVLGYLFDKGYKYNAAYRTLGLSPRAPWAEVKGAYRKRMNQYHPDKAQNRGLSQKQATQKSQQVQDAYDAIKNRRQR